MRAEMEQNRRDGRRKSITMQWGEEVTKYKQDTCTYGIINERKEVRAITIKKPKYKKS